MAFEELTSRQAVMWGSAPFENIAALISEMHVALVDRLAPVPGEEWLDLGCGAGDVAFLAARAGAVVTGSDLSPELVAAAQRRAAEQGARPDPRGRRLPEPPLRRRLVRRRLVVRRRDLRAGPRRVAHELARVCRPGGRLGLTAWRKSSGVGEMFAAMMPYMPPPPPGVGSPFQWADEAYVESMLGDAFELTFEELDTRHRATTGARCGRFFRANFGPAFTLWSSLDDEQRAELDADMEAFFESHRTGDGISLERLYLVATGVRKG